MKKDLLIISLISIPLGIFAGTYWKNMDKPKPVEQCHTFQRTDTSHIRLNSCTGEAHVIVRGPNGFEWQRVVE